MTVEVAGHDALAEELEAAHLGLDLALSVVAGPALPDGPAKAAATAKGIVAHGRPCGAFLPWLSVLAGRNDGGGPVCRDGAKGTVAPDGAA